MLGSIAMLVMNRLIVGGILGTSAFRRRVLVLGAGLRAQRLREWVIAPKAALPSSAMSR
jgi:hypothetical protein